MPSMRWRVARTGIGHVVAQVALAASVLAQGGAPQPDGFRYYWSGACVQAVQRGELFYWRARADTMRYDPAADTMLTTAAALARECAAQLHDTTHVERVELPLVQLLLAAGDDRAAAAHAARRLAAPDVEEPGPRAWVLAQLVAVYLDASPPRLSAARDALRRIAALRGAEAAVGQVRAYGALATTEARLGHDSAAVAAAEEVIAAGRRLTPHDRVEYASALFGAYALMADIAASRSRDAAAPHAVLARARADIGSLRGMAPLLEAADTAYSLLGTPAARLTARLWLNAAGDTVRPARDTVALIVFRPSRQNIPALHRIARRFGRALQITFAVGTYGYFRSLGPLSFDDEIAQMRRFYLDELHIPGAMAISEGHYTTIPDGRRVRGPSATDLAYHTNTGMSAVVVDRRGIIRFVLRGWQKSDELRLERAVQSLLATP
ncbi:MAG: hypothetical protein IRY91_01915 [Gemmatimonadaceae bacterium]|nr:hypothetical protein [Gemmatimonadaceae bacterium]